jgi:hypothetical protein
VYSIVNLRAILPAQETRVNEEFFYRSNAIMNREARQERKGLTIFFANFACFAVKILGCKARDEF